MADFALSHTNSASSSLNLNDGNVYQLIEPGPQGIFGVPYENVYHGLSSYRTAKGVLAASNPVARAISFQIMVHGGSRSAILTNLRALEAHFAVDKRDSKLGTLTYTADNSIERAIKVSPWADSSAGAMEWLRSNPAARGWVIVTVDLEASYPFWYNPTAVEPSGAFSGVGDVNISCANAGDVDAWITQIVITNQATNFKLTDAYGTWLEFTDAVDDGQTLTLKLDPMHPDNFSIVHSVDGDWSGKRKSGSGIPVVKYGTNNLTFTGTDAGDDGTIAIAFNSTYSGHG